MKNRVESWDEKASTLVLLLSAAASGRQKGSTDRYGQEIHNTNHHQISDQTDVAPLTGHGLLLIIGFGFSAVLGKLVILQLSRRISGSSAL